MEVASGTRENLEASGTNWENQRKLPKEVSPEGCSGFSRQRKERSNFQAKGRNALPLIYSFTKYFMEPLCGQGMVLVAGDIAANKTEKNSCPHPLPGPWGLHLLK